MSREIFQPAADRAPESGWYYELATEGFPYGASFVYRIPKDPEVLREGMTEVILAGMFGGYLEDGADPQDLKDALEGKVSLGTVFVPEEDEESAFEVEPGKYLQEAELRGAAAVERVFGEQWESFGNYTASYDRDFGFAQGVKFVVTDAEDPDALLIHAPLSHVFGTEGLPERVIARRERVEERTRRFSMSNETVASAHERFTKIGEGIGEGTNNIADALVGFLKFSGIDRLYEAIESGSTWQEMREIARGLGATLTLEEREALTMPEQQSIRTIYEKPINVEGQEGVVRLEEVLSGDFVYDPDNYTLVPAADGLKAVEINFSVFPVITSSSTHEGIMSLRQEALELTQRLGIK